MIAPVVSRHSIRTLFLARQADIGPTGGEMSRQLPTRPNLEFLRKQAKDRLQDLLLHDPSAQLADAQHAIAGEYGFASWPSLKAHVDRERADQAPVSPIAGEWRADVARSQRHPVNQFRSATIVFDVDGDDIRISDVVVDAAGREEQHVNTIRADGRERAGKSGHGYSLRASWRDPYTLETVGTKDGQSIGGATYAVSPDGRTLTISADQQVIVLDRVNAT
jgi:hypothetical protein